MKKEGCVITTRAGSTEMIIEIGPTQEKNPTQEGEKTTREIGATVEEGMIEDSTEAEYLEEVRVEVEGLIEAEDQEKELAGVEDLAQEVDPTGQGQEEEVPSADVDILKAEATAITKEEMKVATETPTTEATAENTTEATTIETIIGTTIKVAFPTSIL